MSTPTASGNCKSYLKSLMQQDFRTAFRTLSLLEDSEIYRALAIPARDEIKAMFDAGPGDAPAFDSSMEGLGQEGGPMAAVVAAASVGGRYLERISQINYAGSVVQAGKQKFRKDAKAPTASSGTWATDYEHHIALLHEVPLELDEDLTGSLPSPSNTNPPRLNDEDFRQAATTLGCDVAAIRAVASVESSSDGFGADGKPIIRYELHYFQARTQSRFRLTHPHVSQPTLAAGRPYHNGSQAREYTLLYNAMLLKRGTRKISEAIESASWGKFQVMGANWRALGWSSALEFAKDMFVSEGNQLRAFTQFVRVNGLTNALRTHNWAAFASGYNGPGYAVNNYDVNMRNAFNRFSRP